MGGVEGRHWGQDMHGSRESRGLNLKSENVTTQLIFGLFGGGGITEKKSEFGFPLMKMSLYVH